MRNSDWFNLYLQHAHARRGRESWYATFSAHATHATTRSTASAVELAEETVESRKTEPAIGSNVQVARGQQSAQDQRTATRESDRR